MTGAEWYGRRMESSMEIEMRIALGFGGWAPRAAVDAELQHIVNLPEWLVDTCRYGRLPELPEKGRAA